LRRARALGGYLDGPDGTKVQMKRQEFPYDIGIWQNVKQGMGTGNVLLWLWPLARTPRTSGLSFAVNGFEDPDTSWPPPDPDRMPRLHRPLDPSAAFTHRDGHVTDIDEVQAFKARQVQDFRRRQAQDPVLRRKPFHTRFGPETETEPQPVGSVDAEGSESGEEGWQDFGGNRLKDFGVDEDVEFYDEDDIPLSELMRRRKAKQSA
jgi:palmitoyltransferase